MNSVIIYMIKKVLKILCRNIYIFSLRPEKKQQKNKKKKKQRKKNDVFNVFKLFSTSKDRQAKIYTSTLSPAPTNMFTL